VGCQLTQSLGSVSLRGRCLFVSCRCSSSSNKSDWSSRSCRSSSPSSLSFLSDANESIDPVLLLRTCVPESVDGRGSYKGVVAAVAACPSLPTPSLVVRIRYRQSVSRGCFYVTRRAPVSPYVAESSARGIPYATVKYHTTYET